MNHPPSPGDDGARRLHELTADWLERSERGEETDPADLCADRPELLAELRRRIQALRELDAWIDTDGARSTSTIGDLPEHPPDRIGRFRIVRELGRGGMGVVYEAREEPLGRTVALKVLSRSALEHPAHRARFRIEAQALAGLDHAHIVEVYELGHADGTDFIAMPLIDGRSLDRWLLDRGDVGGPALPDQPRGEPAIRAIARIGAEIAEALASAHRSGIFHRDVKPSNILVDHHGHGWLVDFGLARIEGMAGPTRSGPLLGSVAYIAPERFEGVTDPRGDIYSLGVTLYEVLTAKRPFEGESEAETVHRILQGKAVPMRRLDARIPRDLETVVQKAMARDLADRYASAGSLADDLRRFLGGRPISARRVPPAERVLRWHRRSPVVATLVWALFASLSLGLVGTMALYREAERQRREAERQRGEAKEDERWAREALADISNLVAQDSFFSHTPTPEARATLLRKVQDYNERVIARGNADQAARSSWALACRRMAEIDHAIGHFDCSTSNLKRSIEAYESLVRDDPNEPEYRFGLFHALRSYEVGDADQPPSRYRNQWEAHRRALEIIRSLVDLDPANPAYRDCLAAQGLVWGLILGLQGKTTEAERTIRSAIATAEVLSTEMPDQPSYRMHVAGGWLELGKLFAHHGRLEEAVEAFESSGRVSSEIAARSSGSRQPQFDRAISLACKGDSLIRLGRSAQAIPTLQEARTLTATLLKYQPDYRPFTDLRDLIAQRIEDARRPSKTADSDPKVATSDGKEK